MTSSETVRADAEAVGTRIAYRVTAVAAVIAVAGYIAIPTLRSVVENGTATLDVYPTPAQVGQNLGLGVFGFVTFGVIGVAVGTLTLALTGLRPGTLGAQLAAGAGLIASVGFVLVASGSASMYSFITANMAGTGADEAAQRAAVWAINVVAGQGLAIAALGTALWSGWLALARRPVLPRWVGFAACGLALVIAGAVCLFTTLAAQFLYVPLFAVLAIGSWRRSRG